MTYQDYIVMLCELNPVEPWREIFISEMAVLGFESFEEIPGGFKAYIEKSRFNQEEVLSALREVVDDAQPEVKVEFQTIEGENWNAVWESNFEPVVLGEKCFVRAPFHVPSGAYPLELVIEPKMSFGTGHHETTALMAALILEENLQNKSVLDMGCGTGLLGIIAAKLGAHPVTIIDNDVSAYENAQENILRNDCPHIQVMLGDAKLLGKDSYDVIIANITKNILLQDLPIYVSVLLAGGKLFMSGFFEIDKEEMVMHAENFGLEQLGEKSQSGWLALSFSRKLPY